MAYFPIFTDISEKSILVAGGGAIAERRITVLLSFCSNIMVISPSLTGKLLKMAEDGTIDWQKKEYEGGDAEGFDMVIAATNKRQVNHAIYLETQEFPCLVNICDCKEECNFYFPGIAKNENVVAGITASGTSHSLAKEITNKIQGVLDHV